MFKSALRSLPIGLLCLSISFLPSTVRGDATLVVESVETTAGSTVTLNVSAKDDDAASVLAGYNLALDYGGGGLNGLPAGLTFISAQSGSLFGDLGYTGFNSGAFNYDAAVFDADLQGTGAALTGTLQDLFSLTFMVDAGLANDTEFDIELQRMPVVAGHFTLSGDNVDRDTVEIINGKITIQGVPEPGSAALLLFGAGALALRRRR